MIHAIIESPEVVVLQIRRPAAVTVLRSDMRVRAATEEEWHEMSVSLLQVRVMVVAAAPHAMHMQCTCSTHAMHMQARMMIFATCDGEPAGEINLRSVTRLELLGEGAAPELSEATPELAVVTTGETYMLQSGSHAILNAWYKELQKMAASSHDDNVAAAPPASMVWQQGYLEMSVGLDAWEPPFFTLSNQHGAPVARHACVIAWRGVAWRGHMHPLDPVA